MVKIPLNNDLIKDYRVNGIDLKRDDTTITVTDIVSNTPVSHEKQAPTDNVTDIVIAAKNSVKIGYCEFCGSEFEKRVSWKRFCKDDCRIANWEKKNGKQLKGKKVAG